MVRPRTFAKSRFFFSPNSLVGTRPKCMVEARSDRTLFGRRKVQAAPVRPGHLQTGERVSKHVKLLLGLGALAIVAMVIVACGSSDDSSDDSGNVAGVSADTCGEMTYGGEVPRCLIISDLPLQGDSADRSKQMNDAVTRCSTPRDGRPGTRRSASRHVTTHLADTGLWDEQTWDNATAYSDDKSVIGGRHPNSGCARR